MFKLHKKEKRQTQLLSAVAVLMVGLLQHARCAHAEIILLPESRYHLINTYGLFFEEQTSLLSRNGGRAWGALGNAIPLLEQSEWAGRPQLVIHASVNASFRLNPKGDTLLTETIDARAGLLILQEWSDSLRTMVMWTHQSGHVSDNVQDFELFGSNLGNEILTVRVVQDLEHRFRIGASIKPVLGSDPGMMRLGAEQFAEWYPWSASENPKKLSPFLAAGLEETGRNSWGLGFHTQVGLVAGHHLTPKKVTSLRMVAGYYNGVDPRLKYFQFFNRRSQFVYLGLMVDL